MFWIYDNNWAPHFYLFIYLFISTPQNWFLFARLMDETAANVFVCTFNWCMRDLLGLTKIRRGDIFVMSQSVTFAWIDSDALIDQLNRCFVSIETNYTFLAN